MTRKPCKDCHSPTRKVTTGGRCATCARAAKKARSEQSWERRLLDVYGITADEYRAILAVEGGRCPICLRATGARRRLSVDHDHAVERESGSRASVRGVICSPCNKLLGHLRDDPAAFQRVIDYLEHPPAHDVIDP